MIFVNEVTRNLDENVETHAIFTDFAKAIGSVDFDIQCGKLHGYGIRDSLHRWFENYLRDRELRLTFNGSLSQPFSPPSVLGSLLFNVFINDLDERLVNRYLLFAGDLKIYAKIRSLGRIAVQ